MSITAAKKQELIAEYRLSDSDTGSVEVQCAILTHRILELTEHMKSHKHDYASRRGLLTCVSKRTSLMQYLKRTDLNRYEALRQKLGLRK